jgi:hypothetical protein
VTAAFLVAAMIFVGYAFYMAAVEGVMGGFAVFFRWWLR